LLAVFELLLFMIVRRIYQSITMRCMKFRKCISL